MPVPSGGGGTRGRPYGLRDSLGGESEVPEDVGGRGVFAEAVDTDDRALEADVLASIVADACLDRVHGEGAQRAGEIHGDVRRLQAA